MNLLPMGSSVKVWLATGHTDMRCGLPSLALRVQEVLKHDPLGGHLFCFRGRRGDLIKLIWPRSMSVHEKLGTRPVYLPNTEGGAL
ncbi:IS66 family insertion sequence element accessory protein TnpB [Mesorhizobium sp. LNJC394B00]|uniref:IS66 family insertion sequence element accessory protein TnpB n=1 Tax=Mesorhizobium sp. LNJC394B00 TaxID=1287274 RepID=UPI0032AFC4F9